jgi:uracil-DNA glycosylase
MDSAEERLSTHLALAKDCRLCPLMVGPVVTHPAVISKIYLCGQAPGPHEGKFGKPFSWTAGKTLFKWMQRIGVEEEQFRKQAFIGAACRCFPGKNDNGGDRVPTSVEISNCSIWMKGEFEILKPELVIPVGKLAIELFLPKTKMIDAVGATFMKEMFGTTCDIIPLPHPSGASSWFKVEPGATLLSEALILLSNHKVWRETFGNAD